MYIMKIGEGLSIGIFFAAILVLYKAFQLRIAKRSTCYTLGPEIMYMYQTKDLSKKKLIT